MPIRRILYNDSGANDIHLLWGETSRDLRINRLIFVESQANGADLNHSASQYLSTHGDVRVEFRPVFNAQDRGATWEGLGIVVDKASGIVTFSTPTPPARTRSSFLIECFVTTNTGGIAPADMQPAVIRVQVHPAVRKIWMTPAALAVRRLTPTGDNETESRFTLRAEFTDEVVGDVTEHHDAIYSPVANVVPAGNAGGRLKIQAGDALGAVIPITATWKGLTAVGNMTVTAPWSAVSPAPAADLVDGHPDTWAGTINPAVVPNVLILGDAFTTADLPAFANIANGLIHDLKREPLTRPYDRLATSMNFWRFAAPAASRGISVRCEVYTFDLDGRTVAVPMPPTKPPAAGTPWTIYNLLYMAGLPIPANLTKTPAELRAEWAATMRADPPLNVTDRQIEIWKSYHTRTFIDEVDGFPGMALGAPPRASETTRTPMLRAHPYRGGAPAVTAFYRVLRARNNVAITGPTGTEPLGSLWAETRDAFNFDNRRLVVMLAGMSAGRAVRTDSPLPHIAISISGGNHRMPVVSTADSRRALRFNLTDPLPPRADAEAWPTIAHELGHAFGLGDEYVDLPGSYTGLEPTTDRFGNLTTLPGVSGPAGISAALIKWNWHRARKAAVLSAQPTPEGANFRINLLNVGGLQFAVNDRVHLRPRQWKQVIGRLAPSGPLTVVAPRDATGNSVLVSGALVPANFGAGSVLYLPVPNPAAAGAPYGLVSPRVAQFIEANHRPLTRWPCNPADQQGDASPGVPRGSATQMPEFNAFDSISHRNDARVIGLYSGGARLGCGIFHPAGQCLMRNDSAAARSEFCHVCRFILVDAINPDVHWWIDREYDAVFPT